MKKSKAFYSVFKCMNSRVGEFFLSGAISGISQKKKTPYYYGHFCSLEEMDKLPQYFDSDIAVVIQGQVSYENDFTLNSLRLLRHLYPNVMLVLSTWKNSVKEELREECTALGVDIVESDLPGYSGVFNINFQIVSSFSGVKYVKEKKSVKYILKMRTDQRFYRPDFLVYLKNLNKLYPVGQYDGLRGRIAFLGTSFLYVPFDICDFISFGYVEDVYSFYNIPLEKKGDNKFLENEEENRKKLIHEREYETYSLEQMNTSLLVKIYEGIKGLAMPETYFIKQHISQLTKEKIDEADVVSIYETYWKYVQNAAIIVDDRDLLFYWPKYQYREIMDTNMYMHKCGLDHIRWLDIMCNGYGVNDAKTME